MALIQDVIEDISMMHPGIMMSEGAITHWCFMAMENYMDHDGFFLEENAVLPVSKRKVLLPENTYAVRSVSYNGSKCACSGGSRGSGGPLSRPRGSQQQCLFVPDGINEVVVELVLMPINEDGAPIIPDPFLRVCIEYCRLMLFTDSIVKGTMNPAYLEGKFASALGAYRAGFRSTTVDGFKRMLSILRNPAVR